MTVSECFASILEWFEVTDIFGIPGGILLDVLYSLDKREQINLHLCYHEQAAAYAACGYAQCSGKLGVAYGTKGPGVANMITAIADAYYDSLPVLFFTAHAKEKKIGNIRSLYDQETDFTEMLRDITKYSVRIDQADSAGAEILKACRIAMTGRKGPVFIDIASNILKKESVLPDVQNVVADGIDIQNIHYIEEVASAIRVAKSPVFLVGDGVRYSKALDYITSISKKNDIPILSSRISQDLFTDKENYYGYIGSHGLRYSNFILSKADLIVAFGNRLAYPTESNSYRQVTMNAKKIRIDVDGEEFNRHIPNSIAIQVDALFFSEKLQNQNCEYYHSHKWLETCNILRNTLKNYDTEYPVNIYANILKNLPLSYVCVTDIGNHELWFSRAYALVHKRFKIVPSKSFKTVGSAVAKAIGAYYASRKSIACFIGDQGLQYNIQELQYIAMHRLPIMIIVCNNNSLGMIRTNEKEMGYSYFLQSTVESNFNNPDYEKIAIAYGLDYTCLAGYTSEITDLLQKTLTGGHILEIQILTETDMLQKLPKENPCQKFEPALEETLYQKLDKM
nr:thiamine pyrophosphate-binding protein [uncultured Anaerosporobacter sp.]